MMSAATAGALAAGSGKAAVTVPTALSIAGLAASVGGTLMSATAGADYGHLASQQAAMGEYQQKVAERRAQQLEIEAGQERATSQREASEERRQVRFAQSRAQAVAAASGAGALDPSTLDVIGDLEGEAEYRALTRLYEGENRARGLDYGAKLERSAGKVGQYEAHERAYATRLAGQASGVRQLNTVLSGFSGTATQAVTLLEKYG
jgi:hypothetical protein